MGGHKSKSCTFSEPAVITPPPVPDLIVSGDGSPSPNGSYFKDGIYNVHDKYKREDGLFFIYYMADSELWFMSNILGGDVDAFANPIPDTLIGDWVPTGIFSGWPKVKTS